MKTQGSHKALAFSAGMFMLFGGYFAYAAFLTGTPSQLPFVQSIAAKGDDGEDIEHEGSGDDNENDGDDNGGSSKSEKEKKKKEDERKKEEAKKASERAREASKRSFEDDGTEDEMDDNGNDENEGENEVEDKSENEIDDHSGKGDQEGMYRDQAKTLEKLNEKIAEAEKHILEKQAEGVDVTAALAQLALAKEGLSSVDAAFAANELDKIKELAKSTEKLAHFSQGKTLHDSEEVAKDIAKVAKRIAQTERKIAALSTYGGDTSVYTASLNDAKAAFQSAQAQITAGGDSLLAGLSALDAVERRVKSIKHGVEGALLALGQTDDEEFENEHGVEVEDASDDLAELADADDEHGALKKLAENHKSEAVKVAARVRDLEERNRIVRGLIGYDSDVLNDLQNEVAINDSRIATMQLAVDQTTDSDLAALMNEKIGELKAENAKLASYITAKTSQSGVFGWFFRLF
ncbi:MAG: hypothetical protein ACEQSB_06085 [Undibacterium sp.]